MNFRLQKMLFPLSIVYGVVTRARAQAYKRGLLSRETLPAAVISVGNLTTGGTGKTPLVEWICRKIAADGFKVCVLTRGYGRLNPKTQVVVSNGNEILTDQPSAGDEPFQLAENLLGQAAVICNPNRAAAGRWAIENLGTQVFVLDDGFQHLKLTRDLNIVVIDATEPWGGGKLLPQGRMREPKNSLARADCAVITRTDQTETFNSIRDAVHQFACTIPVLASRMVTFQLVTIARVPAELPSAATGAFCGIGNADAFFQHLRRAGFNLAFAQSFPDHYQYKQSDIDSLVQNAKSNNALSLTTTAKDAVKLRSLEIAIPCYVNEIRIEIQDEETLVQMIRKAISKADI